MRHSKCVDLTLFVSPSDLDKINDNMENLLNDKYKNSIFKDLYIYHIDDIISISGGKISHNGTVFFSIKTNCIVVDIQIGETYDINVTNFNKMGAIFNVDKCTIFIPFQYYNGFSINSNSKLTVKILGKRISDNIVCVGSVINSY